MSDDSDSNDMEEAAITSSDIEEIMCDWNDDQYQQGLKKFMPDLSTDEEDLSAEMFAKVTKQFAEVFAERYPSSGVKFFVGSLDNALNQSISNPNDPRPLILYIRHNKSIADNPFCTKFFCSENIIKLLNEEFIIWPWDRTNMTNYRQLLKLFIEKLGNEVASNIAAYSYRENQYPLLICLLCKNNRFNILRIIDSEILEEEMMFNLLCITRDDFDHQNNQDSITNERQNENWHVPSSHLEAIPRQSDQFQKILKDLNIENEKISDISTIENIIWSVQYASEKRRTDNGNSSNPNERELFYGCPLSTARHILREGFRDNSNEIYSKFRQVYSFPSQNFVLLDGKYGRGYYFFSKRDLCEKYTLDTSEYERNAIIICRVLVDENLSNQPNFNTFIVYRNEQILPEYLVIYNK